MRAGEETSSQQRGSFRSRTATSRVPVRRMEGAVTGATTTTRPQTRPEWKSGLARMKVGSTSLIAGLATRVDCYKFRRIRRPSFDSCASAPVRVLHARRSARDVKGVATFTSPAIDSCYIAINSSDPEVRPSLCLRRYFSRNTLVVCRSIQRS